MTWTVLYYDDETAQSVKKWPRKLQAKYLRTIDLIEEFGPQLGEPHTKFIERDLFEIRIKAQEGIARAFFCYRTDKKLMILHTFIKKTQKTPEKELDIAKKRLNEVKRHG